MNNLVNILDVANWFLSKESMTHKKLQKLCWYAYSWALYLFSENIDDIKRPIDGKFEAWVHGPVDRKLYDKYKNYVWTDIPLYNGKIQITSNTILNFLENVYEEYGKYSADQLELQTHNELPWKNARKNLEPWESSTNIISDIDIYIEYSQRV